MKLKDLAANPKNPRKISDEKLEMLKHSLAEFGDLSGFIYNRTTKQLVGGHQRGRALPETAEIKIVKTYSPPTDKGTVAVGYIFHRGERFSYREVKWPREKELAANIAANKGAGEFDDKLLSEMMIELESNGFDLDFTMFNEDERADLLIPSREPNFSEGDEDDQSELDKKKRMECPECGHLFVPGWK